MIDIIALKKWNPGIHVIVQAIPWTAAHEKLLTSYAGNAMPDVFQLGNTWVPEFQILRSLEDLPPWIRTSEVVQEESYYSRHMEHERH